MRYRIRTLFIGVAAIASLLGAGLGHHNRIESRRRLALYHDRAANVLLERTGESCIDCVRSETEIERILRNRGDAQWLAYQAMIYHQGLSEKYLLAADQSSLWVAPDPEPPPGAFPDLEPAVSESH